MSDKMFLTREDEIKALRAELATTRAGWRAAVALCASAEREVERQAAELSRLRAAAGAK